jgi:zinc transport system substrate-binding protein
MKNHQKWQWLIGAAIVALICGLLNGQVRAQSKILVAVSILPQVEFVENVGGSFVDVLELVPPNSSPEIYEPTPGQMKDLSRAVVYFKIGTDLDFELNLLGRMAAINPHLKIIDCSKGIDLGVLPESNLPDRNPSGHYHGLKDPHIWNSLRNARVMIDNITAGLISIDSLHKQDYLRNAENYKQKLDSLDRKTFELLSHRTLNSFIVLHPAWGYFARDYGLTQLSIEGEGKEPSATDIKNLVDIARKENLATVFASPQFNSESAKTVARELGGTVEYIDPLSGQYLDNMWQVASKIAQSLK